VRPYKKSNKFYNRNKKIKTENFKYKEYIKIVSIYSQKQRGLPHYRFELLFLFKFSVFYFVAEFKEILI
jgi:hypothetical protein